MNHSVIRHCRAAASSFVLAAATFAAAADPATNAPSAKPSAIARFASLDDASKFLRDFAAAIGFAGQADDMDRSMRESFEGMGADPSRPITGAFKHPPARSRPRSGSARR